MNKAKFQLHSVYLKDRTYEKVHSTDYVFQSLGDLLLFYRMLLRDGYVYEFQFNRFIKVNALNHVINIIYLV